MIVILRDGVVYFVLIFGVGFVLGVIRSLWVEPQVGTRLAELPEMPVMLGVIVVAVPWSIRRLAVPARPSQRLGVGFLGLGLLIATELVLAVALCGMTLQDSFATRDPVTGTLYYLMLGVFVRMPLLVARK
jgi:hypothetical protein